MKHEIIFFWLQILLFAINVIVFIYLMDKKQVKYKWARVAFIVIMSFGFFINGGETSWFALLFCLTPFITLSKITNANITGIAKKHGDYINSSGERLQSVEGRSKAVFK